VEACYVASGSGNAPTGMEFRALVTMPLTSLVIESASAHIEVLCSPLRRGTSDER
jgi:hypothetical protein